MPPCENFPGRQRMHAGVGTSMASRTTDAAGFPLGVLTSSSNYVGKFREFGTSAWRHACTSNLRLPITVKHVASKPKVRNCACAGETDHRNHIRPCADPYVSCSRIRLLPVSVQRQGEPPHVAAQQHVQCFQQPG